MRTHERNALVWLVARVSWPWVIKALAVVLAYLLLATVMGCSSATGPTGHPTGHPNEALAQAFAQCHADQYGLGDVTVVFHEGRRGDGAIAWAMPGTRTVHVSRADLYDWAPVDIEMTMGHEVAHLSGEWNEAAATRKASAIYYSGACH